MLSLQAELMEQQFAQAEDGVAPLKALETYQRITNTLRRTLESLGLQRRAKDVTPTLASYLNGSILDNQEDEDYRDNTQ